jgi:hypothetical protein
MSNTTIIPLRQPDTIDDPLTDVLRSGARKLLAKAVEAAVADVPNWSILLQNSIEITSER